MSSRRESIQLAVGGPLVGLGVGLAPTVWLGYLFHNAPAEITLTIVSGPPPCCFPDITVRGRSPAEHCEQICSSILLSLTLQLLNHQSLLTNLTNDHRSPRTARTWSQTSCSTCPLCWPSSCWERACMLF